MKRVVILYWKNKNEPPLEIFSNLKILCETYPVYNYNTVNNYLSKGRVPFENDEVKIERKIVRTTSIPQRQIMMVTNRVKMHEHNEEKQNLEYWLSRSVEERLAAVTRLSAQLKKRSGERMDKSIYQKIRLK